MHLILQGVVPRTFEIWKGVRPSQYHARENMFKDLLLSDDRRDSRKKAVDVIDEDFGGFHGR
ncbi:hypothetical protein LIPSTDRAFT_75953 [Lipomyces starkeyi NRRL Y-11557]|uniref:Uncharacterized protein n=1 Tax=Lipomyces starkeyi NRRL Y-11557 TaxID=675824 RepID=A0A1E3PW65_LIPST|nr:hypothetical protein LIPSTDRAFT_75953 [Lipomyces starkeyi NRRL Y-11557]